VSILGDAKRIGGDARSNLEAWRGIGGPLTVVSSAAQFAAFEAALARADVVVDALFGTGLDRAVEGHFARAIDAMQRARALVVSLDVPSGLDADSGAVLGVAVRAAATITFAHYKRGLLTPSGRAHSGELSRVDIGVPPELWQAVGRCAALVEASDVAGLLPRRTARAHKVDAGRVVVFAGSPGKLGAGLLVAEGALRAGAGLVTLAGLPEVVAAFDQRVLEAMTTRLDAGDLGASVRECLGTARAVAVGPGIGLDEPSRALVEAVVFGFEGTSVVDADALSHFAGRPEALRAAPGPLVLTPHSGEAARLLGVTSGEVEDDRRAALARLVESTRAVVLLKGAYTLIGAPQRLTLVNGSGTPALAVGGAGDVLTGIIAAFACDLEAFDAAFAAAFVHGLSGEQWSERSGGERGLLAREIAHGLPQALAGLATSRSELPE
jgi:NAD(P)H-hydrate epimerase